MGSEPETEKRLKMKKRKYVIEDVVMKKSKKIEPLLVNFANGQPLESSELKGILHRKADEQGLSSAHNILTIETPILSYGGKQSDAQSGGVTMFLGVLDHDTGRIRLFETSQYTVQPVLKDGSPLSIASKKITDTITYDEKQEAIAVAFGSKKAKLSVTRKRQNRVETETMSGAIDQAAASTVDQSFALQEYLDQQDEISLLSILPTCDRKATDIQDVYKLEDLAPDSILVLLEEPAQALLSGQDLGTKSTLLFREMVENARHETKYAKQIRLAGVALIVKHLQVFLECRDTLLRNFEKGKLMEDGCKAIIKWIMSEYTVKQGNFISKPKESEDKALCFTLILAFISSKYELSVSTILQSLPIKKDKLNLLMRVIGATYSNVCHSFVLKLPLAKYSQSKKRAKGIRKR